MMVRCKQKNLHLRVTTKMLKLNHKAKISQKRIKQEKEDRVKTKDPSLQGRAKLNLDPRRKWLLVILTQKLNLHKKKTTMNHLSSLHLLRTKTRVLMINTPMKQTKKIQWWHPAKMVHINGDPEERRIANLLKSEIKAIGELRLQSEMVHQRLKRLWLKIAVMSSK